MQQRHDCSKQDWCGGRRRHVGRDWNRDGASGLVPENIERAEWEAQVWNRIQIDIRQAVSADAFSAVMERLRATTKMVTVLEPDVVVKRLGESYKIGEALQERVLGHLLSDNYDGSLWRVINAVTRTAEDLDSYTLATDLEELGGRLTHITPRQWEQLTNPN